MIDFSFQVKTCSCIYGNNPDQKSESVLCELTGVCGQVQAYFQVILLPTNAWLGSKSGHLGVWVENKDTRKPKSIRNFTDVKTKHLLFLIQLSLSFLQEVENFTTTVKSTQLHMLTFGHGMEAIWHLTQRNQFESVDVPWNKTL